MSTAASAAKVRIIHAEPTQLPCCSALDGPRLGFAHPKNCTRIDTENLLLSQAPGKDIPDVVPAIMLESGVKGAPSRWGRPGHAWL